MDNGAQRIALLEQAVATMEFDNQALNNVIIGKSGQSLRNVLETSVVLICLALKMKRKA